MSKIYFLPVKHGDAFIIECVRGDTQGVVVVDGGPRSCGFELKRKLNELGTPDLMVLTHYDEDHIGGILQLVDTCLDDNMIPAKEVWANCAGYVEVAASKYTTAAHGMLLSVRLNELANAASIAFILRCDNLSILMLGDSYPQNVERYLREEKGYSEENPLVVDFVKVSHHGSRNNTSNSLLDIIQCDKL